MLCWIDENLQDEWDKRDAYNAGYDAGLNGPNTTNCDFSLFSSHETTAAWERGNADGKRAKHLGTSGKPSS